jgi:hypothetical protein
VACLAKIGIENDSIVVDNEWTGEFSTPGKVSRTLYNTD